MSWFENFRQQNQHLFGEDSDFSDSEPEFEPGENEEIENDENEEIEDSFALHIMKN